MWRRRKPDFNEESSPAKIGEVAVVVARLGAVADRLEAVYKNFQTTADAAGLPRTSSIERDKGEGK
jgi:hypothetical protein